MTYPMTTWPGQQAQGAPAGAMMGAFGRTPMYAADPGPRYTGPFNLNMGGQSGMLLQMIMPQLLQGLMGPDRIPAQFNPEQNLYDQLQANRFYNANQEAMAIASRRDTAAMEKVLGGVTMMQTGKELTDVQQAQHHRTAASFSKYMPLLTQAFGPDMIDLMHGSKGSDTVFAQQFHQAMRTGLDPITGQTGYSGQSAGRLSQEVFEGLFGANADPRALKGMSAGQAGLALNEMQARGLLGHPMGTMSFQEQRSLIPENLADDVVNRIAETLPEIRQTIAEGRTPDEPMLQKARAAVRQTHRRLTDGGEVIDPADLENMPGGEEIIRATDADRYIRRLKNLSGAVKAMRDIFGDNGNLSPTMREIFNGLDALTQGGMANRSPTEVESMVRRIQAIGKQTGIGLQGIMALTAQNAPLADQLGLDRSFATTTSMDAALFGASAGDVLSLESRPWGGVSKEQLTLRDAQLRMQASASPVANQLSAMMRLRDSGVIDKQQIAGTELESMIQAVEAGQTSYTFNGRQRDLAMPRTRMQDILKRDANVTNTESLATIFDLYGNQEYTQKYETGTLARQIQAGEAARNLVAPVLNTRLTHLMRELGAEDVLRRDGVVSDRDDFASMMSAIAIKTSEDSMQMDPAVLKDREHPEKAQQAVKQMFQDNLRATIRRRMPAASDTEVEKITQSVMQQFGTDRQAAAKLGLTVEATENYAARTNPLYGNRIAMHDLNNQKAQQQSKEVRGALADADAEMAEALQGLGTASPIRRIVDALQAAGPDTKWQDIIAEGFDGIKVEDIINAAPEGRGQEVMDLIEASRKLNFRDPEQKEQHRRNTRRVRSLLAGGDAAAAEAIRLEQEGRPKITAAEATPAQQDEAIQRLEQEQATPVEQRITPAQRVARDATELELAQRAFQRADAEPGTALADKQTRQASERVERYAARKLQPGESIPIGAVPQDDGTVAQQFLTRDGIVTKSSTGDVIASQPFSQPGAAQAALAAFQRINTADAEAAQPAAAPAPRPAIPPDRIVKVTPTPVEPPASAPPEPEVVPPAEEVQQAAPAQPSTPGEQPGRPAPQGIPGAGETAGGVRDLGEAARMAAEELRRIKVATERAKDPNVPASSRALMEDVVAEKVQPQVDAAVGPDEELRIGSEVITAEGVLTLDPDGNVMAAREFDTLPERELPDGRRVTPQGIYNPETDELTPFTDLEEDVSLGDRYLNRKGLVTRGPDGQDYDWTRLEEGAGEVAEALQRPNSPQVAPTGPKSPEEQLTGLPQISPESPPELPQDAMIADATPEQRLRAEKLREAEQKGLILGDLPPHLAQEVDELKALATDSRATRIKSGAQMPIASVLPIKSGARPPDLADFGLAGDLGGDFRRSFTSDDEIRQEKLLKMGIKHGIFDPETAISDVSDEEKVRAKEALKAADLSEQERSDLEGMEQVTRPFSDVGLPELGAEKLTREALQQISQFRAQQEPPDASDDQDRELTVRVVGTVTQRSDGLVDMEMEGKGVMNQVGNTVGMV